MNDPRQSTTLGALPPPPGVTPNFEEPRGSLQPTARVMGPLSIVLVVVSTLIRAYTKLKLIKEHVWEDYIIYLAMILFIPYVGLGLHALKLGAGAHQWDFLLMNMEEFMKFAYAVEIFYVLLNIAVRLSICLQLMHIFVLRKSSRWWILHIFLFISMAWYFSGLIRTIFQCRPIQSFWDLDVPGTCLPNKAFFVATGAVNTVFDSFMLAFPLFCIWNLQMTLRRKIGISAVFAAGSMGLAATIVRTIYTVKALGGLDQTYTLTLVSICAGGELTAGIIAGNLITYPRFLDFAKAQVTRLLAMSSWRSSLRYNSDSSQNYGNELSGSNLTTAKKDSLSTHLTY